MTKIIKMSTRIFLFLCIFIILVFGMYYYKNTFKILRNGNILSPDGIEYSFFANEGWIVVFGEVNFFGRVFLEYPKLHHLGGSRDTGMYTYEISNNDILFRVQPGNEWRTYYRKSTLPVLELDAKNCIRYEFVDYRDTHKYDYNYISPDILHLSNNEGINDSEEIEHFLIELINAKSPEEAGLYEMIRKENGLLENCYLIGYVYGYFQEDKNVAIAFRVWSFNDLAYSIDTNFGKYVITKELLEKLGLKL